MIALLEGSLGSCFGDMLLYSPLPKPERLLQKSVNGSNRPEAAIKEFARYRTFNLYFGVGILALLHGRDDDTFQAGQRIRCIQTVFRYQFIYEPSGSV